MKMSKFDQFVQKLFQKYSKYFKNCPGEQKNRGVSPQEISNGNTKHKIPTPIVTRRFQQASYGMEEIHVKCHHFDLAAIFNLFGSEHLHHRFRCSDHHP